MGIEKNRPGISQFIKGCHITPEYARIDFYTENKFCEEEVNGVSDDVNDLICRDAVITVYPHSEENEAWYWKCQDYVIPCGGTHLPSAKYINKVALKRKNLGKNMERITVNFIDSFFPNYHKE
jgi:alanyl-tRNA synthetase